MSYLGSVYSEFTQTTLEKQRAFNTSYFKLNARLYLEDASSDSPGVDLGYCVASIRDAAKTLSEVYLDKSEVGSLLQNTEASPKINAANLTVKGFINSSTTEPIKIQYLSQYVNNFGASINRALNENLSDAELGQYMTDSIGERVKKQCVRTYLPYNYSIKQLKDAMQTDTQIQLSSTYIDNVVLPFINTFVSEKTKTVEEATLVAKEIESCNQKMATFTSTLNNIKRENKFSSDAMQKIEQLVYNGMHTYMDIVSFISICLLQKIHVMNYNVTCSMDVYNKLKNLFSYDFDNMMEASYDRSMMNTEPSQLAAGLLDGRTDAYDELAGNIYNFHKDMAVNGINPMVMDASTELQLGEYKYNLAPYEDALACINIIGESVTVLDKNTDDYMLVYDDIVTKSGLNCDLIEKFAGQTANIELIPEYESEVENMQPGMTTDIGLRMLHEVKAFPTNIKNLSDAMVGVYNQIVSLRRRLDSEDTVSEFKNTETLRELVAFTYTLEDDYKKLIEKMAGSFMERLRKIGILIEKVNVKHEDRDDVDCSVGDDFADIATESCINEYYETTLGITQCLLEMFFVDRNLKDNGLHVILEEGEEQPQQSGNASATATSSNGNEATKASTTKVTVNDGTSSNTETKKKIGQKMNNSTIKKIQEVLDSWFESLMNKFQSLLDRQGTKNKKWLAANKQALTSRRYSNVEANILPYEDGMPYESVKGEITKVITNIKAMTPDTLKTVKSRGDVSKKIFSFVNGVDFNKEDENLAEILTHHYKTGALPLEVKTISNSDLGAFVNQIIPYCETYYDSYISSIKTQLKSVKDALSSTVSTYTEGTSIVDDMIGMFVTEAGDAPDTSINGSTADQTQNTAVPSSDGSEDKNLGEKSRWMREVVKVYCGAILNALRDRTNDYFSLLYNLVPKQEEAEKSE